MKEYLIECIDRTFDDEDYYKINKYIESLEERIDKAIKYATNEMRIVNDNEYHKLIEILRGESDE